MERGEIARIAEKLFTEVMSIFGWQQLGGWNQDIKCENKKHTAEHCVDAVLHYKESENCYVYVTTDVKSYSKASITPGRTRNQIEKLSEDNRCLRTAPQYLERYTLKTPKKRIISLLFLYNRDNEFDPERTNLKHEIVGANLDKENCYIFYPERIQFLHAVARDIEIKQNRGEIPKNPKFVLHNKETKKNKPYESPSLPIEYLLGGIIVINTTQSLQESYIIYYTGQGNSESEWCYLLLFCYKHSILKDATKIKFMLMSPSPNYSINLGQAKNRLCEGHFAGDEFQPRLKEITADAIQTQNPVFDPVAIGEGSR